MVQLAFYLLSAVVVGAALMVVLAKSPITSAFSLIVSLLGVAALFALGGNGFLAVVQVLIYAGAIVTLFIFVVMLLNLKAGELAETGVSLQKLTGGIAAALVAVNVTALSNVLTSVNVVPGKQDLKSKQLMEELARMIFERFGLTFELMSVLLLVALVGVTALARKEKSA